MTDIMRKWLSIISAVIIFLTVLITAGVWQVNRVLKNSHIENLHYQIDAFSFHKIQLSELSFIYNVESLPHAVQIRNLNIDVEWQRLSPQIKVINVEQVILKGLMRSAEALKLDVPDNATSPFKMPEEWRAPAFFPKQVHVQQLVLKKPCVSSFCVLTGKLDIYSTDREKINVNVLASPGDVLDNLHQLRIVADYTVEQNLPKVDATIAIDDSIALQVSTHLLHNNELYWLGKLKGSGTYLDEWWQPYLIAWNITVPPKINGPSVTDKNGVNLEGDWQLALTPLLNIPATADASQYSKAIDGRLFLDAQIPMPINILGFGQFSGQSKIDMEMSTGKLSRYSVSADITAEQLNLPKDWQTFGLQTDKVHLNLQSKMADVASLTSLPIEFSGDTQGDFASKFSGHFVVDTFAKKVVVDRLVLAAKATQFNPYADYEFKNLNVNVQAVGYWQPDGFSFGLSQPSQASTDFISKSLAINAKSTQLSASKLSLGGAISQKTIIWKELALDSDLTFSVDKLSHTQLNANSWRWQGKAKGTLNNLDVKGDLSLGTALNLTHQVKVMSSVVSVEWKLADMFLLAGNPFADTFKAWPPLLTLARGKMNAQGNLEFNLENNSLKKSESRIQLQDVAGIYDTATFEGINTQVHISTLDKTLKINTDDIKVNQVNKGFVLGPLQAAGNYQANWEKPFAGKLSLKYFNGAVLDGIVSTPTHDFDFSKPTQNLVLTLKQINLTSLLQQHPASELSGKGLLSGNVPIEINAKGIRIDKGTVAAEPPGGSLKYQSARAAEFAKTQPSMKLLTEALNDFQYSVLATEVNYDETGKLILAIKLEGKNPKLEKGRPINFNINFEEDIPAMLASIQLSSKVNDIVKKRLQEYLQKKSDPTTISIKK